MIPKRRNMPFTGWLWLLLLTAACSGRTGSLPAGLLPTSTITAANPPQAASPSLIPTATKAGRESPAAALQSTSTQPVPQAFEPPVTLSGHTGAVTHLNWSPDGTLLASACGEFDSQDHTIRIWRADGTLEAELKGHTQPVTSLSWSPDGKTLASGSLDETIRLWRADGSLIQVLQGHAEHVFAVTWSPDGKVLASGSIVTFLNPTVQLWDRDGKVIRSMSTSYSGGKFYNLGWSPDGQFLLGGATDYKLWRADGTEVFWLQSSEHSTPAWGMSWAPNSQLWAVGNESGEVSIFNTLGSRVAAMGDQTGVNSLAWSPDSQKVAGAKTLWRADGSSLHTLAGQPEYVNSASWSLDGTILATGGSDALIHLWTSEGTPDGVLSGHTGNVRVVTWSPDGKILASASEDQTIRLWKRK